MYLEKHKIPAEKIISQTEDSILLELTIPEECDFFDGHFPEIHLVPAVAQMDMVTFFANKYFGTQRYIESAKRIKFTSPVKPNTTLHLNIKFNAEKCSINYKLTSADELKAYSGGNFQTRK